LGELQDLENQQFFAYFYYSGVVYTTLGFGALIAGWLTDQLFKNQARFLVGEDHELELHEEETGHCFSAPGIVSQLKQVSFPRAVLIFITNIPQEVDLRNQLEWGRIPAPVHPLGFKLSYL